MNVIKFYFDPVSPWAHFALPIAQRYQKQWGFNLVLKPMFLGGVMMGR